MKLIILSSIEQALMYMPLVLGAYISISLLKIPDLSLERAFVMGAIFSTKAIAFLPNAPFYIQLLTALAGSLFGGALVGIISGTINQYGKIPFLLSAIITLGIFHGITICLLGGSYMTGVPLKILSEFFSSQIYPDILLKLTATLFVVVFAYFLFRAQLGHAFAIYGSNAHFLSHYKISTPYVFLAGCAISNAMAGVSGFLFSQTCGFVEITMGTEIIILCVLSIIVGKLFIKQNKPINIVVPIIGTVFYVIITQLLLQCGINLKYFNMAQSFMVLFILIYMFRQKNNSTQIHDNLGV
ncbi:hypothetical protein HN446_03635 [bacterium]|jgi:putative tryptophan/tyrosine transport system permease protein|nr:hypothetical protein [bacterium]